MTVRIAAAAWTFHHARFEDAGAWAVAGTMKPRQRVIPWARLGWSGQDFAPAGGRARHLDTDDIFAG